MSHRITHRSLTDKEVTSLRKCSGFSLDHWAWVFLPIYGGVGLGLMVGELANWLFRKFGSVPYPKLPMWSGTVIAAIGIIPAIWLYRLFATRRAELRSDIASRQVEVIEVGDAQFVKQEEYNDEGPIFYIDIGNGKILFVWGQWMFDESIYAHTSQFKLEQEKENDEDWPHFPSSSFVIHRVNESGDVLSIEIRGDKLKPIRIIKSKEIPLSGHPASMLMDGKLDDLKSAMTNANVQTKRRKSAANR